MRQTYPNLHKRGHDISLENIEKISKGFKDLLFCGQMGDPIYHPKFDKIMDICKNNQVQVSTNGSGKSSSWYKKIHKINPNIKWIFGLDGLPEQSHIYRVNQDGPKVFENMKMLAAMGAIVTWQYIIFRYNENDITKAKALADQYNMEFINRISSRWKLNDPLRPLNKRNYKIRPTMSERI
jgi:MoaA/NifB/PqqE/SkfB family radical SAM enzyme|tara:strand:+ start:240 stop:782 length:543 start_codon:yes stop_codon:yes gene_type:complete